METTEAFETQEMVGALAWPSNDEVCRAEFAKTCNSAASLLKLRAPKISAMIQ